MRNLFEHSSDTGTSESYFEADSTLGEIRVTAFI